MLHETLTLAGGLGCAKQAHCQGVSPCGPPGLQKPCLTGLRAYDQVPTSRPSGPAAARLTVRVRQIQVRGVMNTRAVEEVPTPAWQKCSAAEILLGLENLHYSC